MANGFTIPEVQALMAKDGRHCDTGCKGLYLSVRGKSVSWIYRYQRNGKSTDKSLGTLERVSLKDARTMATRYRLDGIPEAPAEAIKAPSTFREDALVYHKKKSGLWDATYTRLWLQAMENHAFPKIGAVDTAKITYDQIWATLEPIWINQYPTAIRLFGQIKCVIDHAADRHGDRFGRNPARKSLLPEVKAPAQEPRQSISWQEAPSLYKALAARNDQASNALRFLLLTGTPRAAEVFGAKWSEIDGNVWHVPAERMKSGKARDIPLTAAALDVLAGLTTDKDGYLFTGRKGKVVGGQTVVKWTKGEPGTFPDISRKIVGGEFIPFAGHMHSDAMQILLRNMGIDSCVHGLRASLRTWLMDNEKLITDKNTVELCLGHSIAGKVEKAYARSQMMPERRELLERWANYLMG